MKLTTEIPIPVPEREVDYDSHLLLLGSCFTTAVGGRFTKAKFNAEVNPYGVLFNPHSVFEALGRIVRNEALAPDDFFESEGAYMSLDLHGDHRYPDPQAGAEAVNALTGRLHRQLKGLSHVFLTFGTAEVFRYRPTGRICANCHKIPQREFLKERMTVEQIVRQGRECEQALRAVNPDVTVFYTVSPVRYLNEGPLGNSASKGTLACAIEELAVGAKNVYLPVYEVVMDELRDYRFFGPDLVHPNDLAVDWVWEKLCGALFSRRTLGTMEEVEAVVRDFGHRPFHPGGEQYRRFCAGALEKITRLEERFPEMDWEREKAFFSQNR